MNDKKKNNYFLYESKKELIYERVEGFLLPLKILHKFNRYNIFQWYISLSNAF